MYSTPKEIRDWLSEYKILKDEELHTYAQTIRNRRKLVEMLIAMFEQGLGDQWIEPVCHQLYNFYKSDNVELRRFVLDLIPTMVWVYLSAVSRGEKRKCSGLEACLLGIYNLEIVDKDGKPKVSKYTIPTLAVPSIYHEPPSLATLAFTESSLLRYHSEELITVTTAAKPAHHAITAQNRLQILTYVMSVYNGEMGALHTRSHQYYCKLCQRICEMGFEHMDEVHTGLVAVSLNDSLSSTSSRGSKHSFASLSHPRIPLSAEFLVELLTGLYFAMFNGQARNGIEALERIHTRASYEIYAQVLLVTNAIRNSLQVNPSGQPQDGPMGISIALSPAQRDTTFSKHAITNASFRAKRLPEDIDIVNGEEGEAPPNYHDVMDTDRSDKSATSEKASKSKNPLKSIMKKTSLKEEKDKKPAIKKDSVDSKAHSRTVSETNSPKSPKHSVSAYSDIADPVQVQVSVSSARSTVAESVEMNSLPSQQSIHSSSKQSHKQIYISEESYVVSNSSHSVNGAGGLGVIPDVIPAGKKKRETSIPNEETNKLLEKLKTLEDTDEVSVSSNGSMNTAL